MSPGPWRAGGSADTRLAQCSDSFPGYQLALRILRRVRACGPEQASVAQAHGARAAERVQQRRGDTSYAQPYDSNYTKTCITLEQPYAGRAPAARNRRVWPRPMARAQPSACSSGVVPSKNTWMAAPNSAMRLPYRPSAQLARPRPWCSRKPVCACQSIG